jgi:hypothetical protein
MDNPITGRELFNLIGGRANIITYSNLLKIKSLDQLLYPHNAAVVLYEYRRNYGHWVSIIRHKNRIEFMDSTGCAPDDILDRIPPDFKNSAGIYDRHLLKLLLSSGLPIEYNEVKFQQQNTNTCGKWVAVRLLCREIPLTRFQSLFKDLRKKGVDLDQLIIMLTQ